MRAGRGARAARWISGVLTVILLLTVLVPLRAGAEPAAFPETENAGAVCMYHIEGNRVVGAKNENLRVPAGASVKVLAGLIACEWLGSRLSETVVIQEKMIASSTGTRYHFTQGSEYTWSEMLVLALCGSYNDAYDVIAYSIGNGERTGKDAFVELMNARARELGATDTVIGDPTGVADNSYTTAGDLLKIALAAAQNAVYLRYTSLVYGEADGTYIYNRNNLIRKSGYTNSRCRGMCVGDTDNAGVTLVTAATEGNDSYLLILLGVVDETGSGDENQAYRLANRLISWGYTNFTNMEVLSPERPVCTIPVTVSDMVSEVAVRPSESLYAFLPVGCEPGTDILYSIRLSCDELEAPVTEGMRVGYVAAIYQGEIIGTVPLETAGSAERSGFISRLLSIRNLTGSRRVRAGVIFFLVCLTAWIVTETWIRRRRKKRWNQYYSSKSKWR